MTGKKWFSVTEKLPKIYEPVLVITNYGGYDVCHRSKDDDGDVLFVNHMRIQHSNGGVTHWRRLPKPPVVFGTQEWFDNQPMIDPETGEEVHD